jgi:thiol:disulfide interchange protein
MPVLLYFTAPWCGPCQQMKSTTFANADVQQALAKYVLVKLDIDEQQSLAARYSVSGIPAFRLIDAEGNATRSVEGYMDAEGMLRWLKG